MVAKGMLTVTCNTGDDAKVELRDLVPDVTMSHVNAEAVPYNEIEIQREVGRGAFAKVFLGSWRGERVAVKELITMSEVRKQVL